jgi:hypothetical protein
MNFKNYKFLFTVLLSFAILLSGCKTSPKYSDDESIPRDILALMRTLPGFNAERDFYDITALSGWFVDDDNSEPYGLIEAELVNFEWEDYQGIQRRSLFRDFDAERKYSDYIEWLTALNRMQNLLTVTINPNTQNAMLVLSRHLNFPVKFSYNLEFDEQIIHRFNNAESSGSETLGADFIEEPGIYKINYNIDGFEASVIFSTRR